MSTQDREAPARLAARAQAPASAYLPPTLTVLGTVAELTLGNVGSNFDNSGRGTHGKIKP